MPETKIGFDQLDVPAPLWYRKLTNAIILCFLPVYVGFINIVPMSDYKRSILSQIGMAIPFVLKGFAMIIGNGQMYVPSNKTIENTKVWIIFVCLAGIVLSGCNPAAKAHKYFNSHPDEFAEGCADAFPVEETTDSSAYKHSQSVVDSLLQLMTNDKAIYDQQINFLVDDIARLEQTAPRDCDSLDHAYSSLVTKYKKRADDAEYKLKQVTEAAKNVKPVIKEQENTARVTALQQQLTRETSARSVLQAKYEAKSSDYDALKVRWRGKIPIPWYVLVIIGLALGISIKYKWIRFLI